MKQKRKDEVNKGARERLNSLFQQKGYASPLIVSKSPIMIKTEVERIGLNKVQKSLVEGRYDLNLDCFKSAVQQNL